LTILCCVRQKVNGAERIYHCESEKHFVHLNKTIQKDTEYQK
jgi:hypothetical protein